MKPKDLLEYLETGDRTMEHLKQSPKQNLMATAGLLNAQLINAYNPMMLLDQLYGTSTQLGNMQQQLGNTQAGQNIPGGTLRW